MPREPILGQNPERLDQQKGLSRSANARGPQRFRSEPGHLRRSLFEQDTFDIGSVLRGRQPGDMDASSWNRVRRQTAWT